MATKNSITGDEIKSKSLSAKGRENWDRIFAKKTAHVWAEKDIANANTAPLNLKYPDLNTPMLCLVGDSHGEWSALLHKLDRLEIKNCVLLHVGDIGVGFSHKDLDHKMFDLLNDEFGKRGISFFGVRGNHDDPSYFNGQIHKSQFTLLPDYSHFNINGEKFLFVGGAISIDRRIRIPTVSWWEDEEFILKPELCEECDVLITHAAPDWIGPNDKAGIAEWCKNDPSLWGECVAERQGMNKLIRLTRPKSHFCGHLHCRDIKVVDGCVSRILDILEIYEYRPLSQN